MVLAEGGGLFCFTAQRGMAVNPLPWMLIFSLLQWELLGFFLIFFICEQIYLHFIATASHLHANWKHDVHLWNDRAVSLDGRTGDPLKNTVTQRGFYTHASLVQCPICSINFTLGNRPKFRPWPTGRRPTPCFVVPIVIIIIMFLLYKWGFRRFCCN